MIINGDGSLKRTAPEPLSQSGAGGGVGFVPPDSSGWDAARLAELQRYDLLNSAPEAVFDRLTRMGAQAFGTSICLISLVDHDRQWFKARHGMPVRQTERSSAFCDYAIRDTRPTVILDATKDARVAQNPLVTGWPNIRFYAGAPLISPRGFALGTFCVIDTEPRDGFSEAERRTLADFADMVMREFELRRALGADYGSLADDDGRAQDQSGLQGMMEAITRSNVDAVFVLDPDLTVVRCNGAAEAVFGWPESTVTGKAFQSLVYGRDGKSPVDSIETALDEARILGRSAGTRRIKVRTQKGTWVPADMVFSAWEQGGQTWFTAILRDMTKADATKRSLETALHQARAAENARAAMMRIAGHELRTPLNQIRGFAEMMAMQLRGALEPGYLEDVKAIVTGADQLSDAIESILLIADRSNRVADRQPMRLASLAATVRETAADALALDEDLPGEVEIAAEPETLSRVLRELVSNASRFCGEEATLSLTWEIWADGRGVLTLKDDGPGMDRDALRGALEMFWQADDRVARQHEGLGLGLPIAEWLMRAHGGHLFLASLPGKGTRARLVFPADRVIGAGTDMADDAGAKVIANDPLPMPGAVPAGPDFAGEAAAE